MIKHNLTNTRIYHIWRAIKMRCTNSNSKAYKYYGGRGISVCKEWFNSFETFYKWAIAMGYKEDLTIDRIDVNGNYEPSNCRWATMEQQCINQRMQKNNKSGYVGICLKTFKSGNKKWNVNIKVNKKLVFLGYYNTQKEALEARNKYIIDNKLEHPIQEYIGEIGSVKN